MTSVNETYCIEANNLKYPPLVNFSDLIIFNRTARLKNNILCIYWGHEVLELAIISRSDDNFNIFDKNGNKIVRKKNHIIIPVVFIFSRGYQNENEVIR